MSKKQRKSTLKRYAAKLLFQYRGFFYGRSDIMRKCEERIIILMARSAKVALRKAKKLGKDAEFEGKSGAGTPIYFEFVGIMDLLQLGIECQENEVWYDLYSLKTPMERKTNLIPKEADLCAIRLEGQR